MDKHEPCEHEYNDKDNVTVAEVHLQDKQSTSPAASQTTILQSDSKDGNNRKNQKTSEDESNFKPAVDHPLKASESNTNDNESQSRVTPPKIMLQRSNLNPAKSVTLPKVNCKEKILFVFNAKFHQCVFVADLILQVKFKSDDCSVQILCIDNSVTMFSSRFKRTVQSIKQTSVFDVLVGALKQFVMTKSFINKKHEYSLLLLNEEAQLITQFIDQGNEVLYRLQEIVNNCQSDETTAEEQKDFDMTGLFDLIAEFAEVPSKPSHQTAPPFTLRVVFVYGRSQGNLEFKAGKESYEKLTQSPFFFTDCLYIHEDPAESNNVTDIFSRLCELDPNGMSYVLEVSVEGSMSALYNAFAKLCCHPLQRQRQIASQTFDLVD